MDLKWRPVVSSYRNQYKGWYSAVGRTLSHIAKVHYNEGVAVDSAQEAQGKVHEFNQEAERTSGRIRRETWDFNNSSGSIVREGAKKIVQEAVGKARETNTWA